ncbi:MAG: prepilin-type N-terminal cleavage/methylation domain-containing protein [Desulfosporosinus sp.]|nr:prepilin-type N-terminal cleavage/methylation domain-containing protein [Desulfosporosinus sp.]
MKYIKRENGFTLLEVMAVIIIIGILAAIAIPKLVSSTVDARRKADVATAHEVKVALDRYQVDYGAYPKATELTATEGTVASPTLIPKYISKLDKSTTQQVVPDENKGFGVAGLTADTEDKTQFVIPDIKTLAPTNTIMIYLSEDGSAAEVRAYDEGLDDVLWTSAN